MWHWSECEHLSGTNAASVVGRDAVHEVYQGCFHNASRLYGARVHAILFTPLKKVRPPLRRFSRNSQNAQQHYVKVSYTDLHTYGIINVETKERNSFTLLSMAVTVIRKLTTAHRYYVKIPDIEPHRNRSQEMWKLGKTHIASLSTTTNSSMLHERC